jgi:hypothetical protein
MFQVNRNKAPAMRKEKSSNDLNKIKPFVHQKQNISGLNKDMREIMMRQSTFKNSIKRDNIIHPQTEQSERMVPQVSLPICYS